MYEPKKERNASGNVYSSKAELNHNSDILSSRYSQVFNHLWVKYSYLLTFQFESLIRYAIISWVINCSPEVWALNIFKILIQKENMNA